MTAGAQGSPVFDATSLDFTSIQADLITYAQQQFPAEQWTDFNSSNFGTFLIELLATASDLLAYNANAQVLESIITTLTREKNFRIISKSFDYAMKSASPSSSVERVTLDPAGSYPFTISSHLQFSTTDGTIFQPVISVAVASYPGVGYVDVDVIQGQEYYLEVEGQTSGVGNEQFTLKSSPLLDGTLSVSVGADSYSLVSNFIAAGPTDKVYTIFTDENGVTTLTLGDNVNGVIPAIGQNVVATYKVGGGSNTNLPAGSISDIHGTSDGSAIPPQIISVSNTVSATGGGPKQTLANAQQNLPLSLKENDRAVTLQDYSTAAAFIPGVFKVRAVAGIPYGGATPVVLFVVPNGGGSVTDVLRNTVILGLANIKMAAKRILVDDPVYVNLHIEEVVYVSPSSPALAVGAAHQAVLTNWFSANSVDFGKTFSLQNDGYEVVKPSNIAGTDRVFFRKFTVLPYFARHVGISTTGNGTVQDIQVTPDVKRREWLIRIVQSNPIIGVFCYQYEVWQRRLGTASLVVDNFLEDEAANYENGELVGEFLRPYPSTNIGGSPTEGGSGPASTFYITANTQTTMSLASPGLLTFLGPGDDYVVEKKEGTIGKLAITTTNAAMASPSSTISVVSSLNFLANDYVRITGTQGVNLVDETVKISLVPDGVSLLLTTPVQVDPGAVVTYYWYSDDGTVGFTVVDGTLPFTAGDEMYVDTYGAAEDIALRPENFPVLSPTDLIVTTVGGVK